MQNVAVEHDHAGEGPVQSLAKAELCKLGPRCEGQEERKVVTRTLLWLIPVVLLLRAALGCPTIGVEGPAVQICDPNELQGPPALVQEGADAVQRHGSALGVVF